MNETSEYIAGRRSRPVIGLVVHALAEPGAWWAGIQDIARERDVNLVTFPAGLAWEPGMEAVLHSMVGLENVDGLILAQWWPDLPAFERAYQQYYAPLPVVNIQRWYEGYPGVMTDNYQGTYEAMRHLMTVHEYQHVAFIRGPQGNPSADGRYRAYCDALAESHQTLDPQLVAEGDFSREAGGRAVSTLLDERQLRPGKDIEALVSANDPMAMGALEALRERGVRVPAQVALVGFDDVLPARFTTPPLTTVKMPNYESGRRAAEILLMMLAGDVPPERSSVSPRLVVRRSCGCFSETLRLAMLGEAEQQTQLAEYALPAQREMVIATLRDSVSGVGKDVASRLFDALASDLATPGAFSPSCNFVPVLYELLSKLEMGGDAGATSHNLLSALRRAVWPYLGQDLQVLQRAEDLWHQARVLIAEVSHQAQEYAEVQAVESVRQVQTIGQALLATFDISMQMDVLARELPRLGILGCYVSLYVESRVPLERAKLLLAYNTEGRVAMPEAGLVFPTRQLLPDELLPAQRAYSFVVEPLYFETTHLGFVVFEAGPAEGHIYYLLSQWISSALQSALLLEQRERAEAALQQAYADVERQVEARTTELHREVAERERLQQQVITAQREALHELSTPVIPVMEHILVLPLIGDLDSQRAQDIMRSVLAGISEHRAKCVILDVTGVPVMDTDIVNHINKTILAARLKGARVIVTGISDVVAESIVDLGIDWGDVQTLRDLQTGLRVALEQMGGALWKM